MSIIKACVTRRGAGTVFNAVVLCAAVMLPFAVSVHAALQMLFARNLAPLFASAQGDAAIGSITPGTAAQLAAPSTARGMITLTGWSQQGGETVVYSAVGQRIVLATLTTAGLSHRKVMQTTHDAYGNTWDHVQVTGYVDSTNLVPDVNTVWSAARQLYAARCSACHALRATTDFTANQWPGVLETMIKRAALNPEQAALIRQYLQTHAGAP
jgi:nitrate/TMAO reductase-like tetraheme cytochrome c subunit